MEMTWDVSIEFVLKEEGGYSDDPDDSGGATNHGVTLGTMLRIHNNGSMDLDLDNDGDIDSDDVRLVTIETASEIFHHEYWLTARCQNYKAGLDLMKFNCAVNCGVGRAEKFTDIIIEEDVHGLDAISRFKELQEAFYRKAALKGNNQKFLKGWLARLQRCYDLSVKLYTETYGG